MRLEIARRPARRRWATPSPAGSTSAPASTARRDGRPSAAYCRALSESGAWVAAADGSCCAGGEAPTTREVCIWFGRLTVARRPPRPGEAADSPAQAAMIRLDVLHNTVSRVHHPGGYGPRDRRPNLLGIFPECADVWFVSCGGRHLVLRSARSFRTQLYVSGYPPRRRSRWCLRKRAEVRFWTASKASSRSKHRVRAR